MKETWMPPVHGSNLVANSGNTAYGVENIGSCKMPNMTSRRPVIVEQIQSKPIQQACETSHTNLDMFVCFENIWKSFRIRCFAITWTSNSLLSIGPWGTNFNWPLRNKFQWNRIIIQWFPLKDMHLKFASAKCGLFCSGLNVLKLLVRKGSLQYTQPECFQKVFWRYWPVNTFRMSHIL